MTYAAPDPAHDPALAPAPSTRRGLGCALEIVETLVLTLVIYLLIHNFVAQPFQVEQNSMVPTVLEGEYVLIDKVSPRFSDYQRGDIVVFNPPSGQGAVPFIKRVIGVPGDTVRLENGHVYVTPAGGSAVRLDEPYLNTTIDGTPQPTLPRDPEGTTQWTVGPGSYFVMGDNRSVSEDSRFFGTIGRDLIIGRAWLRYFPLDRIGFLSRPTYPGLPSGSRAATPLGGSPSPAPSTSAILPVPAIVGARARAREGASQARGSSATIHASIALW